MEKIGDILDNRKPKTQERKPPPHGLSATVDEIEKAGFFTKKYGRGYWLAKVKKADVVYTQIIGILKEINGMDAKYNKGGRLTNVLTAMYNKNKNGKTKI